VTGNPEPDAPTPTEPDAAGHLAGLRVAYDAPPLDPATVDPDPVAQFRAWFADVEAAGLPEPNAMVLATVDDAGRPAARTVLLKGLDERGLVFYTNLDSAKGRQVAGHPLAALVFGWHLASVQVRVEGTVEAVSAEESDAYFASRPRESRLGAWASAQSEPVESRDALDAAYSEVEREFADGVIPRPPFWGGLRVVPQRWEFWAGRRGRLHDRVEYRLDGAGSWTRTRLQP
jgi:pyridoxamine 5'-phosphate oxidase